MNKSKFTKLYNKEVFSNKRVNYLSVPMKFNVNGEEKIIYFEHEKFILFGELETNHDERDVLSCNTDYMIEKEYYLTLDRGGFGCFAKFIEDEFGSYIVVDKEYLETFNCVRNELIDKLLVIARDLMETDFYPQGRKVLTTEEYSKRV